MQLCALFSRRVTVRSRARLITKKNIRPIAVAHLRRVAKMRRNTPKSANPKHPDAKFDPSKNAACGAKPPGARWATKRITAGDTFRFSAKHVARGVARNARPLPNTRPTQPPAIPNPSRPEQVCGPLVDKSDYRRPRAIWLREAREARTRLRDELASGGKCKSETSDARRM